MRLQHHGRTQQHGSVAVVPAGVHGSLALRAIGHVVQFLHRQRVHIGAQAHHAVCMRRADNAQHTEACVQQLYARFAQLCAHESLCVGRAEAHLRVLAQVAPPLCKLRGKRLCFLHKPGRQHFVKIFHILLPPLAATRKTARQKACAVF